MCHVSHVTCHMLHVTFSSILDNLVYTAGEISSKPYWAYFQDFFLQIYVFQSFKGCYYYCYNLNRCNQLEGNLIFAIWFKNAKKISLFKIYLNIIILLFFRPIHNICHIELPLLAYCDEETPTESKLRSNLEIKPNMASKYCFLCFHIVLPSSIIFYVYIILLT